MFDLAILVALAAADPASPSVDGSSATDGPATSSAVGASMTPYDIDLVPHLVGTAGLIGVLGTLQWFVRPSLRGGLTCGASPGEARCDPSILNDLDRSVVGKKDNDLLLASDIMVGVLALGGLAQIATDAWSAGSSTPGRDFWTDLTVILEATLVATAIAHGLKYAVRRPRPTQYAEVGSIASIEHQLSFPGGHGTAGAALASAVTTTFWLRHPESPWRWAVLGGASAVALFTGISRTEAGFHFYTDTFAGLILGGTVGWLIPYVLRRDVEIVAAPILAPDVTGATVMWSF